MALAGVDFPEQAQATLAFAKKWVVAVHWLCA
jgi:hypothetical protein